MRFKATRKWPIVRALYFQTSRLGLGSQRHIWLQFSSLKVRRFSPGTTDFPFPQNQHFQTPILVNGPFAASGHMVQNPPCWRASYVLGHPKQRKCKFVLMKSLCSGCPSGQLALQHGGFCTM